VIECSIVVSVCGFQFLAGYFDMGVLGPYFRLC
jgi:hypothetical protein